MAWALTGWCIYDPIMPFVTEALFEQFVADAPGRGVRDHRALARRDRPAR